MSGKALLAAAHYNLFGLDSEDVLIDLLTDSGTSAMSARQWAAVMYGDESYAGSPSFLRFEAAVAEPDAVPACHSDASGPRGGGDFVSPARRPGRKMPSNTHFDTTRGNIEATGAEAIDLVSRGARSAGAASVQGQYGCGAARGVSGGTWRRDSLCDDDDDQ